MAIKIILDANVKGLYKKEESNGDRNLLHNIFQILKSIYRDQKIIQKQNQLIIMKQSEMAEQLNEQTAKIAKIGTESTKTLERVTELEEALANQDNVSPALQTAFDNLKAQVTVVDDLIPDVTPPVEPPAEEPTA